MDEQRAHDASEALILFMKYPARGYVKTRLAASLGEELVHGLYVSFIRDVMAMADTVSADTLLAVDAPGAEPVQSLEWGAGFRTMRQTGVDIGERMKNAFAHAFNRGYERAVLIGVDLPDLPAEFITQAFHMLAVRDVALGGSADGGYYLIGFTRTTCEPEYFQGIAWSTRSVFNQTVEKVREKGRSLYLLPEWRDIDCLEDLKRYYRGKVRGSRFSSHTMKYLAHHIETRRIDL